MKAKLTFVGRYTTKKDGSPLVSAKGVPYTSLRIKCNEYGDKYLSGFENAGTKSWKIGDEVEIEVEEKGEYLNFTTPKTAPANSAAVEKLAEKIDATNTNVLRVIALIQDLARELKNAGVIGDTTSDGSKVPDFEPKLPPTDQYDEEINAADIPF